MYNDGGGDGISRPELVNVILWGNSALSSGDELYNAGAAPQVSHSVIQGSGGSGSWDSSLGDDLGGNLDVDPMLGPLQNNGGFTQTMLLGIGIGSSAIDAGDDNACPTDDQRGIGRPQGTSCDIGSVEEVSETSLELQVTGSGSVSAHVPPTPINGSIDNCTQAGGDCQATYPQHTKVGISAIPEAGWTFIKWSGDCSGSFIGMTVTLQNDRVCQAIFYRDEIFEDSFEF